MTNPDRVLVVSEDREFLRVAEAALRSGDALVVTAGGLDAAVTILAGRAPDLLLVDGGAESLLSLIHYARTLAPAAAVYVAADPDRGTTIRAALDLGVDGIVTAPLHGDAVLRALAKTRLDGELNRRAAQLEAEVASVRSVLREARNLIEVASAGEGELCRVALDSLTEVAPTVTARITRIEPGNEAPPSERAVNDRLVLGEEGREAGILELAGGDAPSRATALELAAILSGLLSLRIRLGVATELSSGPARTMERDAFDDVVSREVEKTRRYGRPLSLLSLDSNNVDLGELAHLLRSTDVIGRREREVFVLLPETNATGAVRLRRRLGKKPIGIASASRDGLTRDALVHAARAGRERMRTSPLFNLSEEASGLEGLIDALLSKPLTHAGAHSTYPLLLGIGQACSLVKHACVEASRTAETFVCVTAEGPLASAVREASLEKGESLVVTEHVAPDMLFAVSITSELGSWACAGRYDEEIVSAVHGADPLLADALVQSMEMV